EYVEGDKSPDICRMIIKSCRTMGIEVVREDLNPDEYRAFLEKRKEIVDGQLKELAEKKAAKMLRTT
uniref:39S ribosomal protein L11, mitochondrial n=1 Tax=Parascaris univalens TaxID=6257 RepID=A0A915BJB8_PARUN